MTDDNRLFPNAKLLDKCPACLNDSIEPYVVSVDYHYDIEGQFSTSRCTVCGTAFMNPMPTAADLAKLYPDDYYSYQTPTLEGPFKVFMRKFMRYPRVYTVPKFSKPGRMLDVGCGAGHYLLEMRRQGWSVVGAELSKGAAAAGQRAGLDIRGGELPEANFEPQSFDFVRSNHSFEHVFNPDEILQEMRRILKDDGKLFVGIPNFDGLWARLFGVYWWNFGLPVHTFNYTQKGIKNLLERNGFKVERIVHNSDYSGLIGSLQIYLNAKNGLNKSTGSLFFNHLVRLPAHYVSRLMDFLRQGDCIEVIASKK